MTSYAIGLSYAGTHFHGWQRQPNVPTVQGELEQALARLCGEPTTVTAAGRTDAGVHATGQVIAFRTTRQRETEDWQRALNALTSPAVHIDWLVEVDDHFHPRFGATSRRYVYLFNDQSARQLFMHEQCWCCRSLDADLMHRAAQGLLGEHDFSAFRAAGCQSTTPMRRIDRVAVRRHGDVVSMDITANAFLLHMVRNIARVLHDVSQTGDEGLLRSLLGSKDRAKVGATACPQGLYLVGVGYANYAFPKGRVPPHTRQIEGLLGP